MYNTVIIGHICKDINIDCEGNEVRMCGGAVTYASAAANAMGHKVAAVTRIADKDSEIVREFVIPREDIFVLPASQTTSIQNIYHTPDKERRTCTCLGQAEAYCEKDVPDVECRVYHIAGLIYGDYDENIIPALAKKGKVAVDVQGFLRHRAEDGSMFFEDWARKKELLPFVTYLKTDAAEAEIMTGLTDRYEAAKLLHSWGAKEVVITHNTEVICYDGERFYAYPLKPRNLSGRTGRGDTTFSVYINERQNGDIDTALLYAAATVSLKMETPGQFRGTRQDVEEYIRMFY